jgi:hypothetical protein
VNFRKSCEINEIVDEEAPDETVDDDEVTEDANEVEENDVDVVAGPDHCLDLERVIIPGVDRLRSDSNPESKPKLGMSSGDLGFDDLCRSLVKIPGVTKSWFDVRNPPRFKGVLVHRVKNAWLFEL